MVDLYDDEFYLGQADGSGLSAERVVPVVLSFFPELKSAVDVGCGVGTWLSGCVKNGITDVVGIDGDYVNRDLLRIPQESFFPNDLSSDFASKIDRKFDLAISLEVAEHLEAEKADYFIDALTSFSDIVLFSAAVPHQGGVSHVNEQWPEYWAEKFKSRDYYPLDIVRPLIWDDPKVVNHYRQNIIIYATKEVVKSLFADYDFAADLKLKVTHPELLLSLYKRGNVLCHSARIAKSVSHILSSFIPGKIARKEFRRCCYSKISRAIYPSDTQKPSMYPESAKQKIL